ncbi:MAG: class I SAM-dependent methyltransferase [Candidatus Omnitrophica bacterium]|nr:class I SAM-dependent methyltransferase [Candidatus Omnitrophota bacterium]
MKTLKTWLSHPLTCGLDLDDPKTTSLRKKIIQEKPFLKKIYESWYTSIASTLRDCAGPVLEIGSGAGFLNQFVPNLVTSEIFFDPDCRLILDGLKLPFLNHRLDAIVMTQVLHHIPNAIDFFNEAARCVKPGGHIVMIEPWVSDWSRIIYHKFHHEPFEPNVEEWDFPSSGPLSSANQALPWVIFERDQAHFKKKFPMWEIQEIKPSLPFAYLLSGGVSMRSLMPGWTFGFWQGVERALSPWMKHWAMYAKIVLKHQ